VVTPPALSLHKCKHLFSTRERGPNDVGHDLGRRGLWVGGGGLRKGSTQLV
jgi:hypothetical protein